MSCHRQEAATAIAVHKADRTLAATDRKALLAAIKAGLQKRQKDLNPKNKKKLTRCAELPRGSHIALTSSFNGTASPLYFNHVHNLTPVPRRQSLTQLCLGGQDQQDLHWNVRPHLAR